MTIVDSPSPIDALTDYLGDERTAPLFMRCPDDPAFIARSID